MQEWLPTHPYAWFAQSLLHPKPLPFPASIQGLVRCVDILALMGFVIGCVLSIQVWRNSRGQSPAILANVLFAGLVIYLFSLDDWMHVYDYGRISSPMAAYLTVERFTASWLFLLPSVLMTVRVVVQLAPQVLHAIGTRF